MRSIAEIRKQPGTILAIGSYKPGYQAALDFDFLSGKSSPSLVGIVGPNKRFEKYFWGNDEVLIPCYSSLAAAKQALGEVNWLLNISSGRRTFQSTVDFFETFPDADGAHLFAEDVPEKYAIELNDRYQEKGKTIIGPAGVGLVVPGALKLGVIGGVDWRQIEKTQLHVPGSVAILSASGGMTGEIITMVTRSGHHISFALCFGGDRFPTTAPREAFLAAQADEATTHIVYYGELGGQDEYELAELVQTGEVTKPVIAYIAGVIGETFEQPVQFGHAKALAGSRAETATAKREALEAAGVQVASSMTAFNEMISRIPKDEVVERRVRNLSNRSESLFTSTISQESSKGYEFVGRPLQDWAASGDIALQITAALLGRQPISPHTSELVKLIFLLSIDHGPQVSGALNTIITARAGKGLVDSLAAGLLTVGPRFGGAVTDAAREWHKGVSEELTPQEHVEEYARSKKMIGGIGHKKYRMDLPDPRTKVLGEFAGTLSGHPHFDYAKQIEAITTAKKGNLVLNVDGHIAALMLDVLQQEEGLSGDELCQLIEADFFNSLFVIPRTVGFIAHYLDQKRIDEGLFRLPDDDVYLPRG